MLLVSAADAEPVGRSTFRSYGTRHGLSNLVVNQLLQGVDGLLWVATEDGLFRFDGKRFDRFGTEEGLPTSNVVDLQHGEGATIWVATLTGLARWDGMRFHRLESESGLPPGAVPAVAIAKGRVWVAASTGLFSQVGPDRFAPVAGWPGGSPTAVWPDGDGVLASTGRMVHVLSGGAWTTWVAKGAGEDRIDAVVRDARGVVWARSASHLWSRAPGASDFIDQSAQVPPASERGALLLDARGAILVSTKAGLAWQEAGRWAFLGREQGLPEGGVYAALEDREGSLWLGGLGLHQRLGRGLWRTFDHTDGLGSDTVWSIFRDPAGRLHAGSANGLASGEGTRWKAVPSSMGRSVRAIAGSADGAVWFGGAPAAVVRLAPDGTSSTLGADEGVIGQKILRLRFDREGALWAATETAGLLRLPPRGPRRFERVLLPGSEEERIGDVFEDRAGRIWAAGVHGLAMLENGRWRRFTEADGLRELRTTYVMERRNGELCVVYLEAVGLTCFRPDASGLGPARHIDGRAGLAGSRVYLLGEDSSGRLWVGTGGGVSVFGDAGVEHFGEAQGLPNDDTAAMAFLAEPDGKVWIGTSGGLGLFDGAHYLGPPAPPRPLIVSATLGERALDPRGPPAKVEHGDNTFRARFVGLTLLDPFQLQNETRLLPIEDKWLATQSGEARYTALSPGSYTFELRTRTPAARWSEPARISFAILPAWWQMLWFRGLLMLLGVTAIAAFAYWRIKAREARRDLELRARAEASFRSLIERSPDFVIVHREERIVYANPAAAELLLWSSPEAMVGTPAIDLVHPDDRPIMEELAQREVARLPPSLPREVRLLRRDGSTLIFEMSRISLDFNGERSVLGLGRNVTERKQLEARLLLSDRMASVGTLAAGVAHEINNPLAYVIANQELMADELGRLRKGGAEEHVDGLLELLADAREGAQRVRKIVGGLKTLSRAEAKELRAHEPALIVDQSINFALNEIRHRARLVKDYRPVPLVFADGSRLSQVFINLLVNAAHSIPEGRVELNEIRVTIRPAAGDRVVIEIRDTGVGIPPELIGRIFDPFFTTKEVGEGTGLGLSICHGIVTGLGGEIAVESAPGRGSVFRVTLPAAPDQCPLSVEPAAPPVPAGQRGSVLVVDDDARVAESIRRVLGREHEVTLLANAELVLAHLRAARPCDVIICDLMMPHMTGMELHSRVARLEPKLAEQMVFVTGGAFTESARQFLERVPNARLDKPFAPEVLRALVRDKLRALA